MKMREALAEQDKFSVVHAEFFWPSMKNKRVSDWAAPCEKRSTRVI